MRTVRPSMRACPAAALRLPRRWGPCRVISAGCSRLAPVITTRPRSPARLRRARTDDVFCLFSVTKTFTAAAVLAEIRTLVEPLDSDRPPGPAIDAVADAVRRGELVRAAEAALGSLR